MRARKWITGHFMDFEFETPQGLNTSYFRVVIALVLFAVLVATLSFRRQIKKTV